MMLRVLALTGNFLPENGGMQHSTDQTLRALALAGAEITLFCPRYSKMPFDDSNLGYRVIRVFGPDYLGALLRVVLGGFFFQYKSYDRILLMGHHIEIGYGLLFWLLNYKPVVLAAGTRITFGGSLLKKHFRNMILRKCYENAEKIIAINTITVEQIINYCDCNFDKFVIIPRPVDGSIWKRCRKKNIDKFILTTFGRLEEAKNLQEVLKVVSNLRAKIPNLEYWIIGDGEFTSELKRLSVEYNLTKLVKFSPTMNQTELNSKIQDVDLCILLSRTEQGESFGRIYVEAAAVGIPSIGYAVGGVSVAIDNNVTGFLFQPGDLRNVEAAILKLYQDEALFRELQRQSIIHHKSKFDLPVVGRLLLEALQR